MVKGKQNMNDRNREQSNNEGIYVANALGTTSKAQTVCDK
jgi:hypothetical protein